MLTEHNKLALYGGLLDTGTVNITENRVKYDAYSCLGSKDEIARTKRGKCPMSDRYFHPCQCNIMGNQPSNFDHRTTPVQHNTRYSLPVQFIKHNCILESIHLV